MVCSCTEDIWIHVGANAIKAGQRVGLVATVAKTRAGIVLLELLCNRFVIYLRICSVFLSMLHLIVVKIERLLRISQMEEDFKLLFYVI